MKRFYKVFIGTIFLITSYVIIEAQGFYNGLLDVHVLDVGQGDAMLIKTPSGRVILIDGGENNIESRIQDVLPFWIRDIDLLVLSHPHADHIGGLVGVLNKYRVNQILYSKINYDSSIYRDFINEINSDSRIVIPARAGRLIDFGDGVLLKVIYPFESRLGIEAKNINNESIVAILEYDKFKLLLTGDIESQVEYMISSVFKEEIKNSVIKIPHHGSITSSSNIFIKSVEPLLGLISVGLNNKYGHPSDIVLDRLEKMSIPYYRTDVHGNISVTTDGQKVIINKDK